jgi:DNA-binding response OmpR family regulator
MRGASGSKREAQQDVLWPPVTTFAKPLALIVDDDEAFALSLTDVMEYAAGYRVMRAKTVEEARTIIEQQRVAIVLLDLELGETRGRHLLDDLAGMPRVPPMLVVSGSAEAPRIATEFGLGCVQKPFALDELQAAIDVTRDFAIRPTRKVASTSGTMRAVTTDQVPGATSRKRW